MGFYPVASEPSSLRLTSYVLRLTSSPQPIALQHRRLRQPYQANRRAQGVLDAVALPLQPGAQEANIVPGRVELAEGGGVDEARQRLRTQRQIVLEGAGTGVIDRDKEVRQLEQKGVGAGR